MRKHIKIISGIIAAVLLTVCCSSCTGAENYLSVSSDDYMGLTRMVAGEVDEEVARSWSDFDHNPYRDHVCNVSVHNGKLWVNDRYDIKPISVMDYMRNGYFVGVNFHDEGWVGYYPCGWLDPATPGEMTLVARENCFGFVRISTEKGYVFTAAIGLTKYTGHLYSISFSKPEHRWTWECVATFENGPDTYLYDESEQCIYIFTSKDVKKYSVTDETLTTVKESDILSILSKCVGLLSAVLLNGKIYAGSPMGIYEFDPKTGEERWFPMDYGKYISASTTKGSDK